MRLALHYHTLQLAMVRCSCNLSGVTAFVRQQRKDAMPLFFVSVYCYIAGLLCFLTICRNRFACSDCFLMCSTDPIAFFLESFTLTHVLYVVCFLMCCTHPSMWFAWKLLTCQYGAGEALCSALCRGRGPGSPLLSHALRPQPGLERPALWSAFP